MNATSTSNSPGTIQIRIEDYDGNPLSNATILSTIQPAGAQNLTGVTNSTGYITFTNVTAGQYSFNISKDGYESMSAPINFKGQSIKTALALSVESVTSNNGDSSILIIIVIIVVVVVVLVVVLLLKRRKPESNKLKPLSSINFKLTNT